MELICRFLLFSSKCFLGLKLLINIWLDLKLTLIHSEFFIMFGISLLCSLHHVVTLQFSTDILLKDRAYTSFMFNLTINDGKFHSILSDVINLISLKKRPVKLIKWVKIAL